MTFSPNPPTRSICVCWWPERPARSRVAGRGRRPAQPSAGSPLVPKCVEQKSAHARRVRLIGHVATTNTTILISGETGTGKEQIARAIHQASARIVPARWSLSTARGAGNARSKASCSATKKDHSPGQSDNAGAGLNKPIKARSFSTKWVIYPNSCK